jgi:hypothetical protein
VKILLQDACEMLALTSGRRTRVQSLLQCSAVLAKLTQSDASSVAPPHTSTAAGAGAGGVGDEEGGGGGDEPRRSYLVRALAKCKGGNGQPPPPLDGKGALLSFVGAFLPLLVITVAAGER